MPKVNPRQLAIIAVALWAVSLFLPGIVFYNGSALGFSILMLGWWSLWPPPWEFPYVAWLANPIFIFVAHRTIFRRRDLALWAFIACILALDTLRLRYTVEPENGGVSFVFGPGWGAILWICSLCLLAVAASQRAITIAVDDERPAKDPKLIRAASIVVLALVIGGSLAKSLVDHANANADDKRHLVAAVFKRDSVCSTTDFRPLQPPISLTGPLAISGDLKPGWDNSGYRWLWDSPLDFLSWGVDIVRVGNIDYTLERDHGIPVVVARPSHADGATTLVVRVEPGDPSNRITVSLTMSGQSKPSAEYIWKTKSVLGENYVTCPEFKGGDGSITALVLGSLGLAADSVQHLSSEIYGLEYQPNPRREAEGIEQNSQEKVDVGCPDSIKWDRDFAPAHPESGFLGVPLRIGEIMRFQPAIVSQVALTCSGDSVYVTWFAGDGPIQPARPGGLHVRRINIASGAISSNFYVVVPKSAWRRYVYGLKAEGTTLSVVLSDSESPNARRKDDVLVKVANPVSS